MKWQDKQAAPVSCASVRAVPWADEAEQQLSRLALSGSELSADVPVFRPQLPETRGTDHLRYFRSLRWQDKQAAPVSVPLCEQCHGQMRLRNSFPGWIFCLRTICRRSHFRAGLPETPGTDHLRYISSSEGSRQASSPSLCASMRAVPWADEAEQQISRLDLSGCELSADVSNFGAGVQDAPCIEPQIYV